MSQPPDVLDEMRLRAALRDAIRTLNDTRRADVWEIVEPLLRDALLWRSHVCDVPDSIKDAPQ